ncbi:DUF3450 family protein [Fibrobacter sp. UWP2]|uniref:DUF3450 family protein n=1 Tax=Fibrobacter sp. UWP2 TaxID=1896216 RepID=UPI00092487D2|nr:DUF3450 family protein [Fibrobacter sp. UWP2]SHJ38672.1 Protein of unknown function [Fibrobacter sp. UWP2]
MKMSRFLKVFLCLGLASVMAAAQETVESVRRQIKAVEAETAREKSLHDAEKKRHAEFVEVGRKKVQALSSQNKTLKAEIDSLKAELNHISEARQKTLGTVKWFENRKAKYNESFAKVIDSLVPVFESDFPYRNEETVNSVKEIADQLHKGVIEADDALNRTLEVFYDRIRLGYTTEVWKGFLQVDARNVPGTYLRYGAVASVFVSNDGNDVLWLSHTADGGYAWKNVSDDLAMRTVLKDVMKVAEGKTAPRLVMIPVSIPKEAE